ncbi:MAG: hypothetical protein HY986_15150 [Candidatus Melainabacteria bacterium]|nr:hypothetical protein [Candidatus Melainabacteria bacterium]
MAEINWRAADSSGSRQFPYRFLLRRNWPEHIETALLRTACSWLSEMTKAQSKEEGEEEQEDGQYLGDFLCCLVAVHPETPSGILDILARSASTKCQERVAENNNSWTSTLSYLANLKSSAVRSAVSENRNTSLHTIMKLAHDESADVRYAVADNANLNASILLILCQDENVHVAARANRTLNRIYPTTAITFAWEEESGHERVLKYADRLAQA